MPPRCNATRAKGFQHHQQRNQPWPRPSIRVLGPRPSPSEPQEVVNDGEPKVLAHQEQRLANRRWTQRKAPAACQGRPDPPSHRIANSEREASLARPPAGTPVIRSCGACCCRRRAGHALDRNGRRPTSERPQRSRTPIRQQRQPQTNRRAREPPLISTQLCRTLGFRF